MKNGFDYAKCKYEYSEYTLCEIGRKEDELYSELGLLLATPGSSELVRQSYGNIQASAEQIARID